MAEERIEIKYNKEDCPCIKCKGVMFCEERDCAELVEWECQEKDIVYNRQEAIEKMNKAACKANKRCIGGECETCTSKMPHEEYTHQNEAALNALLEGK